MKLTDTLSITVDGVIVDLDIEARRFLNRESYDPENVEYEEQAAEFAAVMEKVRKEIVELDSDEILPTGPVGFRMEDEVYIQRVDDGKIQVKRGDELLGHVDEETVAEAARDQEND